MRELTQIGARRCAKTLLVKSAWIEPEREAPRQHRTAALADTLRDLAGWLGLDDLRALDRGDLAFDLSRELACS